MAARPDHPEPLPADSHTDPTPRGPGGLVMAFDRAAVVPATGPECADPASPGRFLSTGARSLDELLGGGWPAGVLAEVAGRGRSSLALGAVRSAQAAGQPVVWVDGPGSFCPTTAGVDLQSLVFVRPGAGSSGPAQWQLPRQPQSPLPPASQRSALRNPALFAVDILLRSRAFALLVLDMPPRGVQPAVWFRLARLARKADALLLLLHDQPRSLAGSAASLSLQLRLLPARCPPWVDPPCPGLSVRVLRHRIRPASQQGELSLGGQGGDPCSPA